MPDDMKETSTPNYAMGHGDARRRDAIYRSTRCRDQCRLRQRLAPVKRELMDILACPLCKGTLQLTVTKEDDREIVEGSLTCEACSETYPIEDTTPNLLPPELRY